MEYEEQANIDGVYYLHDFMQMGRKLAAKKSLGPVYMRRVSGNAGVFSKFIGKNKQKKSPVYMVLLL